MQPNTTLDNVTVNHKNRRGVLPLLHLPAKQWYTDYVVGGRFSRHYAH